RFSRDWSSDVCSSDLEVKELEEFARKLDGIDSLEKWDFAYYSEKLKKEKYEVDDELLKPYFQLEKVVQGVFATAGKLYDLEFIRSEERRVGKECSLRR